MGRWAELHAPAAAPGPVPPLPAGYTLGPYAARPDPAALWTLLVEAFADQWGHRPPAPDEAAAWDPTAAFPAAGTFLAYAADDRPAGVCRATPGAGRGATGAAPRALIDYPGVLPAQRGRGLEGALLHAAVAWLRRAGSVAIDLEAWGNLDLNLAAAHAAGFAVSREGIGYRGKL